MRMPKRGPVVADSKRTRKELSADGLHGLLHSLFEKLTDPRRPGSAIPLADCLMAAFAMFSLKDPSLLAFDERRNDQNMSNLYHLGTIPSDTQMRKILDGVDPLEMRPVFNAVLAKLQRGKGLEPFVFYEGCYLAALDGTGYFSSDTIHCAHCLVKHHADGRVSYAHQMLGAAIIHPDRKEVIPLAPEPIVNGDGQAKNDCERTAACRLLRRLRAEHPRLKLIITEDGLSSNAPHIRELIDLNMHFILGVKPGDHQFLFDQVIDAMEEDRQKTIRWRENDVVHEIEFLHDLALNESNQDLRVNYLEYSEYDLEEVRHKHFSWVTDFTITRENARLLVRGGRARWKIENETFNTLKNQGYHFEHNFGHGNQNLSVVFAMMMMLAFLVDQVQQLCCPLFRAAWAAFGSKRALWEALRAHVHVFIFESMRQLYEVMRLGLAHELPLPNFDSS